MQAALHTLNCNHRLVFFMIGSGKRSEKRRRRDKCLKSEKQIRRDKFQSIFFLKRVVDITLCLNLGLFVCDHIIGSRKYICFSWHVLTVLLLRIWTYLSTEGRKLETHVLSYSKAQVSELEALISKNYSKARGKTQVPQDFR